MLDEIFNGSESEDNYKRNYTSTFKSSKLHLIFHMYMYIVISTLTNVQNFLARMKRTNREKGEAIGLNEPRPVPARQNRSCD